MRHRIAIVATHPIQYFAPWYRELARQHDLQILFAHQQDAAGQAAAGFGVQFEWNVPVLEGYPYRWLQNTARDPGLQTFGGCDTPGVTEVIRAGRFDAVVVSGWSKKCFIQAWRACRQLGVPVFCRGDSQRPNERGGWHRWAKHLPFRWFLRQFDAHLCVGQRNREYLRHYGVPEERLFFTPHCVENERFARGAAEARTSGLTARLRAEWGIPVEAFVFLFVGKFIPKKHPEDFVAACQRAFATPTGADCHAVLVGDGPLRPALESAAAGMRNRIHFVGFRNQSELPAVYAAADVLVLPSNGQETWGLVVNEAMACGLPVIVSEAAGCAPDLVVPEVTGFHYPVGEVEEASHCLVRLRNLMASSPARISAGVAAQIAQYTYARATTGLEAALRRVNQHTISDRVASGTNL